MSQGEPPSRDPDAATGGHVAIRGPVGPRDRDPRRPAGLILALLIAFVGIAIAKPWGQPDLTGPTSTPSSSIPTGPSRTAAPTVEGTPSTALIAADFTTPVPPPSSTDWTSLTWHELVPDDPLQLVTSAMRWRGGYVALGWDTRGAEVTTPLWTSTDGATWRLVPAGTSTTFWPTLSVLAIAALPTGLVALLAPSAEFICGAAPCPSTASVSAWTSSDGRSWSPHAFTSVQSEGPPHLAAGPNGLVAISAGPGPRIATSADGITWQGRSGVTFPTGFQLLTLQGTATGYVAGGRITTGPDDWAPALLWSADGLAWTVTTPAPNSGSVPTPTGLGQHGAEVNSIIAGHDGLIATGWTIASQSAVLWWQSTDGRTWRSLPTYTPLETDTLSGPGGGTKPLGTIAADGSRVVAVRGGTDTAAWTSSDGARWQELRNAGELPSNLANLATVLPGGILLTDGYRSWFGEAHG